MTRPADDAVPPAAALLGAAGLIPFVGLAAATWLAPMDGQMAAALTGYGVVILSFMGGCRWGLAAAGLGQGASFSPLAISVLPALYAWAIWALLPAEAAQAALAAGLLALLFADIHLTSKGGAPAWWPRLRMPLSVVASISLLAAASAGPA